MAISSAGISFSNAAHSPVPPARRRSGLQDWRLCIFIFIAALATAQLWLGHLKGDTAWFMTFAEEYAAGLEPYVGISSPNPPPAFLAYVPPIGMARTLGMKLEFAAAFMILAGAGRALFAVAAFCKEPNVSIGVRRSRSRSPLSILFSLSLLFVSPSGSICPRPCRQNRHPRHLGTQRGPAWTARE